VINPLRSESEAFGALLYVIALFLVALAVVAIVRAV
jgi:hypothetical protein